MKDGEATLDALLMLLGEGHHDAVQYLLDQLEAEDATEETARRGGKTFQERRKKAEPKPAAQHQPTGHGSPKEEFASAEQHAHAVARAKAKFTELKAPTKAEAKAAVAGIRAAGGANAYRKKFVGNSSDRARRRKILQTELGDGTKCPCIYCGVWVGDAVGEGTLEQDKIYTTAQGGRYKPANLVPSCSACNKVRSDTPFVDIAHKLGS